MYYITEAKLYNMFNFHTVVLLPKQNVVYFKYVNNC